MYLFNISIAVIIPEMTTELFSVFSYALRAIRTGICWSKIMYKYIIWLCSIATCILLYAEISWCCHLFRIKWKAYRGYLFVEEHKVRSKMYIKIAKYIKCIFSSTAACTKVNCMSSEQVINCIFLIIGLM